MFQSYVFRRRRVYKFANTQYLYTYVGQTDGSQKFFFPLSLNMFAPIWNYYCKGCRGRCHNKIYFQNLTHT